MIMLYTLAALPHMIYFFIWRFPKAFETCIGRRDPVKTTACLSLSLKTALVLHIFGTGLMNGQTVSFVSGIGGLSLCAIGCGQLLNGLVFYRLGERGVFYGNKFGHHVPWVNGFPFNVFPHPQYLGAVLSLVGLYPLVSWEFVLYSCMLYGATACVETYV